MKLDKKIYSVRRALGVLGTFSSTRAHPPNQIRLHPVLLLTLLVLGFGTFTLSQGEGPPRRIARPSDTTLARGAQIQFRSFQAESLGDQAGFSVFLPPAYQNSGRRFPVIYFLHGMNNDHTSWTVDRYGNIPRLIEEMMVSGSLPEFVLVSPDGDRSFYTDFSDGSKQYERFVWHDLIQHIESQYQVLSDRSSRAIGGTSMGGYGALKIAMKKSQLYASVVGSSPIILLGDPSQLLAASSPRRAQFFTDLLGHIYGQPIDTEHWQANRLSQISETADLSNLNIYFAYGTADRYSRLLPMEKGVRTLSATLEKRKINHTMKIYPNEGHGWELVRDHLAEMLQFLTQTF